MRQRSPELADFQPYQWEYWRQIVIDWLILRETLTQAKKILEQYTHAVDSIAADLKNRGYEVKIDKGVLPLQEVGNEPVSKLRLTKYFTAEDIEVKANELGVDPTTIQRPSRPIEKQTEMFEVLIRINQEKTLGEPPIYSWKEPQIRLTITSKAGPLVIVITPAIVTYTNNELSLSGNYPGFRPVFEKFGLAIQKDVFPAVLVNRYFFKSPEEFKRFTLQKLEKLLGIQLSMWIPDQL